MNKLPGARVLKTVTKRVSFLKSLKDEGGQIFIEAIVAVSVAIIGLLGVLVLTTRTLAFNFDASQKFIAAYLAAEGIEIVKSLIDENHQLGAVWNDGVDWGIYEAKNDDLNLSPLANESQAQPVKVDIDGRYSYDTGGEDTPFRRIIRVTAPAGGGNYDCDAIVDEIVVNSEVQWSSRGVANSVNIEDHFFNWRADPPICP